MLSLGDSYTIGEGVEPGHRWPVQLAARLRTRGFDVADPLIIARTGWTTGELRAALDESSPARAYDLVTLQIGVNDQYRGERVASYRQSFASLLKRGIGLASGQARAVLVLSVPDWGVTPFAKDRDAGVVAAEIDAFNSINREITERCGARYVDVTGISRAAARDPTLLARDGLHPSREMYALWVAAALPDATRCLDRERAGRP
jgi:lysophospholipase L1-like esterase